MSFKITVYRVVELGPLTKQAIAVDLGSWQNIFNAKFLDELFCEYGK